MDKTTGEPVEFKIEPASGQVGLATVCDVGVAVRFPANVWRWASPLTVACRGELATATV